MTPDPREDPLAKALKAFLHLLTPGPDDDGCDPLNGLGDSWQFDLGWAPNVDEGESSDGPTITAGQIRRAREALAALSAPPSQSESDDEVCKYCNGKGRACRGRHDGG